MVLDKNMAVAARLALKRKAAVALLANESQEQAFRVYVNYAYISRILYDAVPLSRQWFDEVLPSYNDRDFRKRMRMARPTFYKLADIINERILERATARGRPNSVNGAQALCALMYYVSRIISIMDVGDFVGLAKVYYVIYIALSFAPRRDA